MHPNLSPARSDNRDVILNREQYRVVVYYIKRQQVSTSLVALEVSARAATRPIKVTMLCGTAFYIPVALRETSSRIAPCSTTETIVAPRPAVSLVTSTFMAFISPSAASGWCTGHYDCKEQRHNDLSETESHFVVAGAPRRLVFLPYELENSVGKAQ